NGNFRLAADGRLVTAEGYTVRDGTRQGQPIVLDSARTIAIAPDGAVTQDGQAVGRIELAGVTDLGGLVKQNAAYFRIADPALKASVPTTVTVEQGKLEASNTGAAESAVRLVDVMRQFEMLQKAAGLAGDMSKRAIEDVARV